MTKMQDDLNKSKSVLEKQKILDEVAAKKELMTYEFELNIMKNNKK